MPLSSRGGGEGDRGALGTVGFWGTQPSSPPTTPSSAPRHPKNGAGRQLPLPDLPPRLGATEPLLLPPRIARARVYPTVRGWQRVGPPQ